MKTLGICIAGSLRSLEYTKDNIVNLLIKPNNEEYKIKIFIYLPNDNNSTKIELLKDYDLDMDILIEDDIKLQLPNCIWNGRPVGVKIDNVSTAGLSGYLQQLYGIEKSYNMLKKYEKDNGMVFDVILRTRSDVVYLNPLDIKNYDLTNIILPNFHQWHGVNDRFGLGNRNIMDTYMKMYSNIYEITEAYLKTNKRPIMLSKAEAFCKLNLDLYNIKYIRDDSIRFNRIRMGGTVSNDSF